MAARNGASTAQAQVKPAPAPDPSASPSHPTAQALENVAQAAAAHWLQWCELRSARVIWYEVKRTGERQVRVTLPNGPSFVGTTLAEAAQLCEDRLQRATSRNGNRVLRRVGGELVHP